MHLKPGEVVLVRARVVEDFDADARVVIIDSRASVSLCLDKSQIARNAPVGHVAAIRVDLV